MEFDLQRIVNNYYKCTTDNLEIIVHKKYGKYYVNTDILFLNQTEFENYIQSNEFNKIIYVYIKSNLNKDYNLDKFNTIEELIEKSENIFYKNSETKTFGIYCLIEVLITLSTLYKPELAIVLNHLLNYLNNEYEDVEKKELVKEVKNNSSCVNHVLLNQISQLKEDNFNLNFIILYYTALEKTNNYKFSQLKIPSLDLLLNLCHSKVKYKSQSIDKTKKQLFEIIKNKPEVIREITLDNVYKILEKYQI